MFSYALNISDFSDPQSIAGNLGQYWAPDAKEKGIAQVMEVLPQMAEVPLAHGQQAVALARRLPVSAGVSSMLSHVDARWDGITRSGRGARKSRLVCASSSSRWSPRCTGGPEV